ncbi:MAG: D-erythronate dehydrogenase [Bradyrhizobium sp.]
MHVLIIGAAGMIGRKLAERLAKDGAIGGKEIAKLTLVDIVPPAMPQGLSGRVTSFTVDFALMDAPQALIAGHPDLIFHLASIVSGEAETDFEKGYLVNLDGTRRLFEAIRLQAPSYRPRVVFTSSIAVYGAPLPSEIPDDYITQPLTSYGTQKAICELLLADYSRRAFFDGIALRLPTICIRPGAPNRAASGFFSNILREPLAGKEAVLPVSEDVRHWFASPRAAVGFLLHAASLDLERVGPRRSLNMPGLSATVADEIAALRRFGGEAAVRLIRRESDPIIERIISGWPRDFNVRRAQQLGFVADTSFDEIVRAHIEDEMDGTGE